MADKKHDRSDVGEGVEGHPEKRSKTSDARGPLSSRREDPGTSHCLMTCKKCNSLSNIWSPCACGRSVLTLTIHMQCRQACHTVLG
jgi:hypothetical protein